MESNPNIVYKSLWTVRVNGKGEWRERFAFNKIFNLGKGDKLYKNTYYV